LGFTVPAIADACAALEAVGLVTRDDAAWMDGLGDNLGA
jgi:hypothetical protein